MQLHVYIEGGSFVAIKEKVEFSDLCSNCNINKASSTRENLEIDLLHESTENSKSLNAEKNDWILALSHELRTPLNVILSTIQVAQLNINNSQDGEYSRVKTRYLDIMKQNCMRLLKMVNNLIEINRIDSGFFNIDLKNENIIHIVKEMTLSVTEYAKMKNIELTFESNKTEYIMAVDVFQLERIMLNLLSNAIKFTPSDGNIKVMLNVETDEIFISVSDTGPGIPEKYGDMIFERYCQTGGKSLLEKKGSGMGLYLVKKLLDKMNGRIWSQNNKEDGATFTLSLPNRRLAQAMEETPTQEYVKSRAEYLEIEFSDIYVT